MSPRRPDPWGSSLVGELSRRVVQNIEPETASCPHLYRREIHSILILNGDLHSNRVSIERIKPRRPGSIVKRSFKRDVEKAVFVFSLHALPIARILPKE